MNDRSSMRATCSKGTDMSHHVMANCLFLPFSHLVINLFQMIPHFLQLKICDGDAEFLLRLRQCQPQSSPGYKLPVIGKDLLHFLSRITGTERIHISVMHGIPYLLSPITPIKDQSQVLDHKPE